MELKNIKIKDVQDIDVEFSFFHYTDKQNIEGIDLNGLLPQIGNNSIGTEKTEKIFFVIGDKGIFSIFDSWIRWLIAKRVTDLPGKKADLPFYRFCLFIMRLPIIRHLINVLVNFIIWLEFKIKFFKVKSFQIIKNILDNSCLLKLDLKDGIDFSYEDIDEIKSQKFDKKLLKTVYAKQNKLSSKKMDYWNMHTFSNTSISPSKITLLKINDSYSCIDILLWMIKNTNIDIKTLAPFLYEFLNYYNLID